MSDKKFTKEEESKMCEEYTTTNITQLELSIKYNCSRPLINRLFKKHAIKRKNVLSDTKLKNLIKVNENYFETIDTPSKAYYLGFILADGNINPKSNSLNIKLAIKDKKFLEDFLIALESDHHVFETNSLSNDRTKTFYAANIRICRPKICSDLTKHGVGANKSKELYVSPTIPKKLINHYIRGIHCGDGSWTIDKKNNIHFSIVSSVYSFAEELKNIIVKECSANNVKVIPKEGCWGIHWVGNIQCKRIYDYLYSDGGPWLDRKYELSTKHFNNYDNGIKTRLKEFKPIKENPKIPSELDRILGFV